jgi:hypothetical protein
VVFGGPPRRPSSQPTVAVARGVRPWVGPPVANSPAPPVIDSLPPLRSARPQRARGVGGWAARMEDRLFPPVTGPSRNRRGVLAPKLSEAPALLAALVIGIVAAALLENAMMARPVPAGGDPGQWLSTAYAYVGLPYPSWIVPGQYPPLLFPLLGGLVLITGGPIAGALAYVAVVAVLIGLSLYFLARSLTRRRSTALLAEAIILLNPTLLTMFFWGFYPNLLGFVFMNLALGFLIRFIRSRRPLHLYLFWVSGAAAVLTHTLVGAILVAVVGLFLVLAISFRVLPREFYRSRAAFAGFTTFLGGVGGFYAVTAALRVPHPQYFQSGAFAHVRNGTAQIFDLVLRPFVHTLRVSPANSVGLLWGISAVLALFVVGLWIFWRSRMTLGILLAISLALGALLPPAIGWEFAVVTDYSRFSYFLVAPIGLGIALGLDGWLTQVGWRQPTFHFLPASSAVPRHRWRSDPTRGSASMGTIVLTAFVILVVGVSEFVSAASLPKDEKITTQFGHDPAFLKALHYVQASGVPGSLLTFPGVAKWTRAILVRDAYFPNVEARYTFDPTHLVDEEQAYFGMTSRYVATNGAVAVTGLGNNLSAGNDSFAYQPAYYGSFTPVLSIPLSAVSVAVVHGGVTTVQRVHAGGFVQYRALSDSSFQLTYGQPGFSVTVTVSVSIFAPSADVYLTVTAAPGYLVRTLQGNLTGRGEFLAGSAHGSFEIVPPRYGSALATSVNVTPASALEQITTESHPGRPAQSSFQVGSGASPAQPQLSVWFSIATPGASTLVPGLPHLFTTDQVWANWSIRFILYTNSAPGSGLLANLLPNELGYLKAEYGATVLGVAGHWTVLIVPRASDLPTHSSAS